MPKILIVGFEARGFINKFFSRTISELKKRGWVVDVACTGDAPVENCDTQYDMTWKRDPLSCKTIASISAMRKIIEEGHYDLVHCNTPVGGYVTRLAARRARQKGLKVIYCAHGFHFYRGARLRNWLYMPIERCLSRFTDLLLTINQEDYDLARELKFKAKRIALIDGVGVEIEKFADVFTIEQKKEMRASLGLADDDVVLTFIGDLNKNKNQQYLVDVVADLKPKLKIKLLLAGPEVCDIAREKVHRLGLDEDVIFLGWRSDVAKLLSISDYIVPSSIREGLPTNVIEAMAMGRVVVATNNRGHRSIIESGKNGILVSLDDHREMSDAILALQDDAGRKAMMVANAKASVVKYGFDIVFNDLLAYYESLLATDK